MGDQQSYVWLRALSPEMTEGKAIVCFPHSGGSADTFRSLAANATDIQWWATQYPGRGDRLGESPLTSIEMIADEVVKELVQLADNTPTIALFGHSLGALIAYEVAVKLEEVGRPPTCLFVSASPSPWQASGGDVHQSTDDQLWSTVCGVGGIASELAGNTEFRDLLLPALRADITANETYVPTEAGPVRCPIRSYYSPEDHLVSTRAVFEWAEATTGGFTVHERDGGHFHLFADSAELVEDIMGSLDGALT